VNVFSQKLVGVATAFQITPPVNVAHVSNRVILHPGVDVAFA